MFWPNAIVREENSKKTYSLFTYGGEFTVEEAKMTIDKWKSIDNIKVLCGYIQDSDTNSIVYLENNVDSFGNVKYENNVKKLVRK